MPTSYTFQKCYIYLKVLWVYLHEWCSLGKEIFAQFNPNYISNFCANHSTNPADSTLQPTLPVEEHCHIQRSCLFILFPQTPFVKGKEWIYHYFHILHFTQLASHPPMKIVATCFETQVPKATNLETASLVWAIYTTGRYTTKGHGTEGNSFNLNKKQKRSKEKASKQQRITLGELSVMAVWSLIFFSQERRRNWIRIEH